MTYARKLAHELASQPIFGSKRCAFGKHPANVHGVVCSEIVAALLEMERIKRERCAREAETRGPCANVACSISIRAAARIRALGPEETE